MGEEIVRPSLGRQAILGDLYDIRTDSFCEGSLLNFPLPRAALKMSELSTKTTEILLSSKLKLEDKFAKFHIKPEMMINVLGGVCIPEGASEYLCREMESPKTVSAALLHTEMIAKENLDIFDSDLEDAIAENAQKVGCATHVVTGVTWGVQLLIHLQVKNEKNFIEHKLKSVLGKFENVLKDKRNVRFFSDEKVPMKFLSDLMQVGQHTLPQTYKEVVIFLENLPDIIINSNSGKGTQISYILLPLSALDVPELDDTKVSVLPWTTDESRSMVQVYMNFLQIKQRILDAESEWTKYAACIPEDSQKALESIKLQLDEVEFKLNEALRRKPENAKELIMEYKNKFKDITEAFSNLSSISKKVKIVAEFSMKTIQYIQKGENVGNMLSDFPVKNLYVLNYHTEVVLRDEDRWESNMRAFLDLVNSTKRDGTCKFIFVDHDFDCLNSLMEITICYFKNGNCISTDFVALQVKLANLCLAKSTSAKPFRSLLPKKRAFVKILCPGALDRCLPCENSTHKWQCFKCRSFLEYGFDGKIYCSCGCAQLNSFEFKCNHKNHGNQYKSFKASNNMTKMLNELNPSKQLNILILGETGVGKSTWINGFANYLTFESLEEAAISDPRYLISSSFTMTDDTFQERIIAMGSDENESLLVGQSATQMPKSYVLHSGETSIRLIDTPGIGDTRGAEQDKENFQNILAHLSYINKIHGIIILLKPNNSRLTVVFQFCVKELLTHLHKDASKNIVFIFTNARSTFYRPGDTLPPLRSLLEQHDDIMIPLNKDTIYCMDNESIRFLAAASQGIKFNESERENYSMSWKTSVTETNRLINHIASLKPHSTRETLSLNEARNLILQLTEPMAEISRNINDNIILVEAKKQEVEALQKSRKELKGKLTVPVMDLVAMEIPYPRTVCTSSTCTESLTISGIQKVNYKQWCHERCYLENIEVMKYPHPGLLKCTAMAGTNNCQVCNCPWDVHMHMMYECKSVSTDVKDANVETLLNEKKDSIGAVNLFMDSIATRIAQLNAEQDQITKVAPKFGKFLKQNAITPYNDVMDQYLEHCIRREKEQVEIGGDDKSLKALQKTLAKYREEVKLLDKAMRDQDNDSQTVLLSSDIPRLMEDLYRLPITGATLKNLMTVACNSKGKMAAYNEKIFIPQVKKYSTGADHDVGMEEECHDARGESIGEDCPNENVSGGGIVYRFANKIYSLISWKLG